MKSRGSRLVWGATLFSTPGMKTGMHVPIVMTVVVVVIAVAVALTLIQRSWRTSPPDNDPGDGWGGGPKRPRPDSPFGPRGGIPLDHSVQASVRLRGAARLSEMRPSRPRRRVREPDRAPVRR